MSSFEFVVLNEESAKHSARLKTKFEETEKYLKDNLSSGRSLSLAITRLEEAFMWAGKAIRDDQLEKEKQKLEKEQKDLADAKAASGS